jgi:uncharacterized protein (DUF1330 family)
VPERGLDETGKAFIAPEEDQIRKLADRGDSGPIVMLNLIRFRDRALEPAEGMTGAEAYGKYSVEVQPLLEGVGGRVLAAARCEEGIIGPADPEWDMVLMVEYPNAAAFLRMIGSPDYLEAHRYRAAALADSRLVASTGLVP